MPPMSARSPAPPKLLHRGVKFDLELAEQPTADGGTVARERIVHRGSVVILPLLRGTDGEERVVMIRNHRFAVDRVLWELPAGTLDPDEAPVACAGRELVEETGYRAADLSPLLSFYPAPGFLTELMHAFVARELTHVGQRLEPTERIEVEPLPWSDVLELVRANRVEDAKTIATLLYHRAFSPV